MNILASIDIGSNTILLLVAKTIKGRRIIPLRQETRTPRLAYGLKQTGRIAQENLKKAVEDIRDFKQIALSYGAQKIYAVATQAVRSAANRDQVVKKIEEATGIKVEVISGKKEAEFTCRGAVTGFIRLKSDMVVFDIGGASSEFSLMKDDKIVKSVSLPIGAVEITEKYKTGKVTSPETLALIENDLNAFFRKKLRDYYLSDFDLVGSGGTISTLKVLDIKHEGFNPKRVHGSSLHVYRLNELIPKLAAMKLSERKRVLSFDPDRAEVIVAGGLILKSIIRYFSKHSVRVSTRSLRWGFLLSKL